jgi:hypothetical protein
MRLDPVAVLTARCSNLLAWNLGIATSILGSSSMAKHLDGITFGGTGSCSVARDTKGQGKGW